MKIRNGFVSNSSSSSFVVAFDRVPVDVQDLQQMLFGNAQYLSDPFDRESDDDETGVPAEQVSQTVWSDMHRGPIKPNMLVAHIQNSWISGPWARRYENINPPPPDPYRRVNDSRVTEEARDKWWSDVEEWAHKAAEQFVADNAGASFYTFEYSDNDGPYFSILEHGETFGRLPYIRQSNH